LLEAIIADYVNKEMKTTNPESAYITLIIISRKYSSCQKKVHQFDDF